MQSMQRKFKCLSKLTSNLTSEVTSLGGQFKCLTFPCCPKGEKNNTQTKGCRLFELETPHFMLLSSQGVRKIRPLYRKSVYFRREFSKNNLFHIWKHNHYHKFKLQNVYVSQTMYVLNWHLKPKEKCIFWNKKKPFASAKVKKTLFRFYLQQCYTNDLKTFVPYAWP